MINETLDAYASNIPDQNLNSFGLFELLQICFIDGSGSTAKTWSCLKPSMKKYDHKENEDWCPIIKCQVPETLVQPIRVECTAILD